MIDYDPHHWWSHFFDIKGSMVREIVYRVLFCVLLSVLAVCVHKCLHWPIAIPKEGHILIGLALSLLLVIRTNSSYDRFWEGRKQWGSIVNETRNLGRAAGVLLDGAPELLARLMSWTIAFPWATMHQLRGTRGAGPANGLPADEVRAVLEADHPPLAIARRISEQLAEARRRGLISDYVHMTLDSNVQQLVDYLGACERIHKTPLPFAYVVHLRRALVLYCYSLPFALLDVFGWGTIPATLVIAYTLFGIEEIGVEIEDPFGGDDNDLPLERICATIEGNLRALLQPPAEGAAPVDGEKTHVTHTPAGRTSSDRPSRGA